ncbi:CPBP family intramembrane glutamic endopeptidase [Pricia sp. S334]|uniref:CPBP family intramembrane glutamic endopeptidase n=1 Tax=Pricia mediterranea TaxID=3076079 RepID=A0ABU3LAH2_9FLAO|nr:CPBP family intramembrane glutamic endopeptidase [Pricia sp. S334]MDT7830719.1 CPBP family intramembrane glutamic endopeptidase [Pricia sp. S334]
MLTEIWDFVKNPIYKEDDTFGFKYRISIFLRLLGYSVAISLVLSVLIAMLEATFQIKPGEHALSEMLDEHGSFYFFLFLVVVAPPLEELIFRGPLIWFKNSGAFKYVFYLLSLSFGIVHLGNFESFTWFNLLLILPQTCVGLIFAFLRVRFDLMWAVALHACYNLVLAGPILLMKILNIPLE